MAVAAYALQLRQLLPQGRAWTVDAGSVLMRLLRALAAPLARFDAAATRLLDESLASRAYDLLPDWEKEFGLPDKCTGIAASITERRAALLFKQVHPEYVDAAAYHRVAAFYGVSIRIEEFDKARADAIAGLDTSDGRWRYVWWISIPTDARVVYFTTLSDVNTPLAAWDGVPGHAELECRLREMAPAHTYLVITYHAAPRRLIWLSRPLKWLGRQLVWEPS